MFDHGGKHRDDPTTNSFQKSCTSLHTSGARGGVTRNKALEAIRGAGSNRNKLMDYLQSK